MGCMEKPAFSTDRRAMPFGVQLNLSKLFMEDGGRDPSRGMNSCQSSLPTGASAVDVAWSMVIPTAAKIHS